MTILSNVIFQCVNPDFAVKFFGKYKVGDYGNVKINETDTFKVQLTHVGDHLKLEQ